MSRTDFRFFFPMRSSVPRSMRRSSFRCHRLGVSAGFALAALLSATLAAASEAAPVASWRHASLEDFRRGQPGNSGHNIFVSHDGTVRTIRRFDLNDDGYLDLFFNNTHDWHHDIPPRLVEAGSDRRISTADLAIPGSSRVIVRDLNRDGEPDLLFLPNRQNSPTDRSFLRIAWGGPDGWSARRITAGLPLNAPSSMAVADLNRDGWPDILALNSEAWSPRQPSGRIVRIYWGGPDGYLPARVSDLGIPQALEIVAGDFDGDGFEDAAVACTDGRIQLLWAREQRDTPVSPPMEAMALHPPKTGETSLRAATAGVIDKTGRAQILVVTADGILHALAFDRGRQHSERAWPASPASQITVADLDGDGRVDAILTNYERDPARRQFTVVGPTISVLWGDGSGFAKADAWTLSPADACATSVGDYDGDGRPDLAVAVFKGKTSMTAQSLVYFGQGNRQFQPAAQTIETEGALWTATVPAGKGHPDRVIFCSSLGGTLGEAVESYLYWGGPHGFAADRIQKFPVASGYKSLAADLRGNGHIDLITVSGAEIAEPNPAFGAYIYWGGEEGEGAGPNRFSRQRQTLLHELHLGSSNVADLNRDGYLDLVLGEWESPSDPNAELVIYYGSAEGFTREHRVALKNPQRTIGCLVADFDRDTWLDIAVYSNYGNKVTIFFGGPNGFSETRKRDLATNAPVDLEAADLNGDGWLDLLVGSYQDALTGHHDTGLTIYWGGPQGFVFSNAQWLPGMSPIGIAVADLDRDGFLDIVSPHYMGELSRDELPSYIYWGSPEGYSPQHRTSLFVDSGHDVVAGDFDGDGRLDLAFSAHSNDRSHLVPSPIFFNDGARFTHPRVQWLPAVGPHSMWVQDIGNIYDRSFEETYDSAALSWNAAAARGRIEAESGNPAGTRLKLEVRSAPDPALLKDAAWRPAVDGEFPVGSGDRSLQYRVHFLSPNGDRFPVLRSVRVTLWPEAR